MRGDESDIALNRLTGKSYSGPGACAGTPAVTFTYDQGTNAKGRRTAMAYGSGYATTWRYDGRGRVISETQTIAATAYTTLSGYDAADRLQTLTYPGGEVVTTTYTSQGLAASMVGANVYVPATLYDAAGRVISRTLGSGTAQWQTQYSYYAWTTPNGQGRLQQLRSGTLAQPGQLQDSSYTYDAVGNVRTIVDAVNSNQKQCFQYDPLDRLTQATTWQDGTQGCNTQQGVANYSEGYDYYKGGSLKRKGAALDPNDGLYTYDANHPHAAATYRGNSYSYDANGNMTGRVVSGVTYTLTYNAENRLTQVVSGTLTASYTYNGDGNRVRSVITASGAVTETHYVGQHYEKTVGSGDTKYYFIAGQLVAFERSSGYGVDWGRRFVFRDHLGSTNVIINGSSGLLLWRDRYLPFGDVRDTYRKDNNPSFSLQTAYRFTGQRLESRLGTPKSGLDRGLYFYGSRWYDSSLGRFIQPDTIVPQPGNPQALNRYSYVLNNPLRYTDPTGMFSEDEIMKYYGVKTWDEVLALYEKGGRLEGLWGWLETLRRAELGDRVSIWDRQCTDPRCNAIEGGLEEFLGGVFAEQDGQLVVLGGTRNGRAATFSADAVALIGRMHFGYSTHSFLTRPQEKYYHVRFDKDKVDWTSVGLGVAGLGQDAGMAIAMAGAATVNPVLLTAGISLVGIGTAAEATGVLYTYAQFQAGKATGMDLTVSVSTSIFGLVPGPVGVTSNGVGILWDMHYGVSITP